MLLSDVSSFPEVAGDAGVYFNPQDKESMLKAFLFVLDKNFDRDNFVSKGYAILSNFSWDRTVEQTLAIYKEAL